MMSFETTSTNFAKTSSSSELAITTFLTIFDTQLQQLKKYLKPQKNKQKKIFLMLGPHHAGKTSWFNQAKVGIVQTIAGDHLSTTIYVLEDAIFIDIPGTHFEKAPENLWFGVAKLLKKHFNKNASLNVLLFFNLATWIIQTREEQNQYLQQLKLIEKQFSEQKLMHISLHIIFTHFDRLVGFPDFFAEFSEQQRSQVWGIIFPPLLSTKDIIPYFSAEFSQLIARLQPLMINRLHHERNSQKRLIIKDFPLQLETVKNLFLLLLQQLLNNTNEEKTKSSLAIRGLYFCSTAQDEKSIDCLQRTISQHFSISTTVASHNFPQHKSFFIRQLFKHILSIATLANISPKAYKKNWKKYLNPVVISCSILASTISIAFLVERFHSKINAINTAESELQHYQFLTQQNDEEAQSIHQAIVALNSLEKAVNELSSVENTMRKKAEKAYFEALQTQLLPIVATTLEKKLSQNVTSPSSDLYNLLKAYLMLGNLQHRQADLLSEIVLHSLQQDPTFSKNELQQIVKHLKIAVSKQSIAMPLNNVLILQTRKSLNTLPYPLLIYLTLKSDNDNLRIPLVKTASKNLPTVLSETTQQLFVPVFYTKQQFAKVYQQKIPELSKIVINGDWVLGQKETSPEKLSREELIQEVRTLYVSDYVNWWNFSLIKTQLVAFKNLEEADQGLTLLAQDNSPLFTILAAIAQNTSPMNSHDETATIFNDAIANKFAALNEMYRTSGQQKTSEIDKVRVFIRHLQGYINSIYRADDIDAAAFNALKAHWLLHDKKDLTSSHDALEDIFNYTASASEPLKSWLENIANNCLAIVMAQAKRHIESHWKSVFAEYQQQIKDHFPIMKESTKEISVSRFVEFFGTHGSIQQFISRYLEPFVDKSGSQWQTKNLHGIQLPITETALQQFERAYVIKQMFFKDGSHQISVPFSLQPIQFEPIVHKVTLTINGQLLEDNQGENSVSNFDWPGSRKHSMVQLEFNTVDNQYTAITLDGEWAWFRLLSRSNVQATDDPRIYQAIFDLNGNAVKYQITARDSINPFIPNIIDHFRAPDVIF